MKKSAMKIIGLLFGLYLGSIMSAQAARPFNSRLDKSKLTANGFTPLPTWQDALHRFLKEIGEI